MLFNLNVGLTLDHITAGYPNHDIYILDINTTSELVVVVAPNGNVQITFEKIGDTYQVYDTDYDNVKFVEVAWIWGDTVIHL